MAAQGGNGSYSFKINVIILYVFTYTNKSGCNVYNTIIITNVDSS